MSNLISSLQGVMMGLTIKKKGRSLDSFGHEMPYARNVGIMIGPQDAISK